MEEAFDIIDVFMREQAVDLIILDSVAALSPKAEREGTMEEWQTALVPRLYTKFLRKWAMDLEELRTKDKKVPTTIFINQIRKKTGIVYGNPEIMPGGDAQYFFGTTIIKVTKKKIHMSKDKADPQPLQQDIRFVIEKSKASPVKQEGMLTVAINKFLDEKEIRRDPGWIDNEKTLLEYARRFNVFEEKAGKYKFNGSEFKNQDEIKTALKDSVSFRRDLFNAVAKAYSEYLPSAVSVGKRKGQDDES